jgi:hypothetical protein
VRVIGIDRACPAGPSPAPDAVRAGADLAQGGRVGVAGNPVGGQVGQQGIPAGEEQDQFPGFGFRGARLHHDSLEGILGLDMLVVQADDRVRRRRRC